MAVNTSCLIFKRKSLQYKIDYNLVCTTDDINFIIKVNLLLGTIL
jgi:hypothetical protein